MPDVLQKSNDSNDFKNGSVVVSIDKLGNTVNHIIDPAVNQTSQIAVQSGILDTRFDDPTYYGG